MLFLQMCVMKFMRIHGQSGTPVPTVWDVFCARREVCAKIICTRSPPPPSPPLRGPPRLAAARNVTERGHRRAKNHHAQAPSVPIRRAGRRARDKDQVLPYALGGDKSVIGGIHDPSVAPHLNRQFLREVRLSFFFVGNWSGRAVERHARYTDVHVSVFFLELFFQTKKSL